jgi:predicted dienelactone hydrolase
VFRSLLRQSPSLAFAAWIVAGASSAAAQDQTVKIAGRDVAVWRPHGASGRQAILIFSHGFSGCATQSKFLTGALAAHGYWVFAPNHKDARCGQGGARGTPMRLEEPLRDPEKWTDQTYRDRADDIRAILQALRDSAALANQIDFGRLGLIGHSLGGYTVVGLGGGWASWKLPGVKAVLALSPYSNPFLAHNTLGAVAAPIMYQGGTRDLGITPWLKKSHGAYESSPAPKYFVEFTGAGHLAWSDLRSDQHELILAYSIPFLDRYVRNQTTGTGDVLTNAVDGVAELRYQSELGTGDSSQGRRRSRPLSNGGRSRRP